MGDLEQRMRKALTQLVVISTAPAQNVEGRTSHGKPGTIAPPKVEAPHLEMSAKWQAATSDRERESVVAEAEKEIVRWRYSAEPAVDCSTKEGRLWVGLDERDIRVVRELYPYSVSHIYRLRRWATDFKRQFPELTEELLALHRASR